PTASPGTRETFRKRLRENELNDKIIEVQIAETAGNLPMLDIPGMPGGSIGAVNLGDLFGKMMGGRTKPRRITVKDSHALLIAEESDKLIDNEQITSEAIRAVENNGIVFLDEIDKICSRGETGRAGAEVSREGVQRD